MLFREHYALMLNHASDKLAYALNQIPLASLETIVNAKSSLDDLTHQLHHEKFEERAAMAHQTKEIKAELERAYFNNHEGIEEVKTLIQELVGERGSSKEELKEVLALLKRDALEASLKKEKQMEFELESVIAALSESAEITTNETPIPAPDMEDCLCCPISKTIMHDPVLIKENGMTYERSSITEWFSRGHQYDPLTNIRLESMEIVPNHALRIACQTFLGETGTSSFVDDPEQDVESRILHGLYEGQGKLLFGSRIVHTSQLMILQPNGWLECCTLYVNQNEDLERTKMEIGKGKWNRNSLELSFEDSVYKYKGSLTLGANPRHLEIDHSGKVSKIDDLQEEYDFHFLYSSPQIGHSIWARPGILQMDGDITTLKSNVNYSSGAMLALQADSRGRWDSDGSITINVYFPMKNKLLNSETNPTNHHSSFRISGSLTEGDSQQLPYFAAVVLRSSKDDVSKQSEESLYVPLDDLKLLEYSYLRQAHVPWYSFHSDPLELFRASQNVELESGYYAIRSEFLGSNDLTTHYLHVWTAHTDFIPEPDTHVSWAASHPDGHDALDFSELWQIKRLSNGSGYTITLHETHTDMKGDDQHVGKALNVWLSEDVDDNHGDSYLCVSTVNRPEEQCVWTLRKCGDGLNLVVESDFNPPVGKGKEYFVSNPVLERDNRSEHTYYAPLSQIPEEALKVILEPVID
eukprot:g73.t1